MTKSHFKGFPFSFKHSDIDEKIKQLLKFEPTFSIHGIPDNFQFVFSLSKQS
jgi:hypothetical protein